MLRWYGQRLAFTDVSPGWPLLERAVRLFQRAGRPSEEYAYAVRSLTRNKIGSGRTSGTEDLKWPLPANRGTAGALDAGLAVAADRVQALFEAGRVEEALRVMERAQSNDRR